MKFTATLKLKLIYVFRINDKNHIGCLKIGETTADTEIFIGLAPNCKELMDAAHKRIKTYTQTAGITYELLYTELCIYTIKGTLHSFSDSEVHKVLERSGIKKKIFDDKNNANEWYITDLETVKNAIKAVKEGKESLHPGQISKNKSPIVLRNEQRDAINKTINQFKKGSTMLWNAKMRFGKTLSALQLVKEMNYTRTLILTHRPVVDKGWFEDFVKIFNSNDNYKYGSKSNGGKFETLETSCKKSICNDKYIYFASIQDLRGSVLVGGQFEKNIDLFKTSWDLVIIDEAHEGTQTELGKSVVTELLKKGTKLLQLSGTPFNLLDYYKEDEIFTWDYVMEQRAKVDWDKIHFGDSNPYSSLPRLNIYTYDLGKLLNEFIDEDVAFNFREFFRVNQDGKFVHEKDVKSFLNLITKSDTQSNYPYSTEEYRGNFRHSLWMVPGVKEAKALSAMLQSHPVFSQFKIVNVAGDGDEEESNKEALEKVENAIGDKPHETYTITLSCGRLTTGVSVPAWTAVFMLSGSFSTSAASYMQTIFRVQTPATINGRIKEECFVFDFAPDRTLKVIAEAAKMSAKAGKTTGTDRHNMGEFLNFCPIIAVDGSRMKDYNVDGMLEQLKKAYVERVVRNGFEDGYLYHNDNLMKLGKIELKEFEKLKGIIGSTKAMPKTNDIDINNLGFTNEQYEQMEDAHKKFKSKKELTEKEKKLLAEKIEKKKIRDNAISILRGISIRMPLLIYGANVNNEDKELNIDNFTHLIDDQSWDEFMPKGVDKEYFNKFKKYYEPDVFRAAGKRIRAMARAADNLSVEERIERITNIFTTFRNPDKETVLTPWHVVNMHLGDCLGGYVFFNENYKNSIEKPRLKENNTVTQNVFNPDSRILEINSKSGLYPLYMAYSIYRSRIKVSRKSLFTNILTPAEQQKIWDKVIAENIFVICKTPMAISITKRTLVGFRDAKVNTQYFEDLVNEITNNADNFIKKVKQGKTFWKSNNENNMKFNAIVGNPPYQVNVGVKKENYGVLIFGKFVDIAKKLKPDYVSMITPSRWFTGGRGLEGFRNEMLNDDRLSYIKDFIDSKDCFPGVDIAGGISFFLWDKNSQGNCTFDSVRKGQISTSQRKLNQFDIFPRYNEVLEIIKKVKRFDEVTLNTTVGPQTPFGFITTFRGKEKYFKDSIALYTSGNISYVSRSEVTKNSEWIDKYKVIFSKATSEHAGTPDKNSMYRVFSTIRILKPNEICTQSYLVGNVFENELLANNFIKYLRTRFVRILLLTTLTSQDLSKDKFEFVPLQDFSSSSDIDWSKPIEDIDNQLYNKYGLIKEEIAFIESMIKPMD